MLISDETEAKNILVEIAFVPSARTASDINEKVSDSSRLKIHRFRIPLRPRHKFRELMTMPRDDNDCQQYRAVIALDLTFILRRPSTAVSSLLTIIFVGSDKESYRQNEQARLNLKASPSASPRATCTSAWEWETRFDRKLLRTGCHTCSLLNVTTNSRI